MAGISLLTALEIVTNPMDLKIVVNKDEGTGKYEIEIMRGPGHNFKLLISSDPFANNPEDASKEVKRILEALLQHVIKQLENPTSLVSCSLKPNGQAIDEKKILNSDLINRIVDELRHHRIASTYMMK